jgi:hypothetical protein
VLLPREPSEDLQRLIHSINGQIAWPDDIAGFTIRTP